MDLTDIIINVSELVPAAIRLLLWVSFLLGVLSCGEAVLLFIKASASNGQSTMAKPFFFLILGCCMVGLPIFIETGVQSLTGQQHAFKDLMYMDVDTMGVSIEPRFNKLIGAIFRIVQFFGFVGVMQALGLWKKAADGHYGHGGGGYGQGQDLIQKGFWHFLGGTLAINYNETLSAINNSVINFKSILG